MSIGENIKKIRKEKNITQVELASMLRKSESTIRKYESDRVTPNIEILTRIARILEVELNDLLGIETSAKKINKQFYENANYDELSKLLKPIGNLDMNKIALLSTDEKLKFLDRLANIDPVDLKLRNYIDDFDNFTKQDLIDYSNFLREHSNKMFFNFIDTDFNNVVNDYNNLHEKYNELVSEYNKLVEVLSIKDKYISSLKESISNYQQLHKEAQQIFDKISSNSNTNE